jgi:hypothetical protein
VHDLDALTTTRWPREQGIRIPGLVRLVTYLI